MFLETLAHRVGHSIAHLAGGSCRTSTPSRIAKSPAFGIAFGVAFAMRMEAAMTMRLTTDVQLLCESVATDVLFLGLRGLRRVWGHMCRVVWISKTQELLQRPQQIVIP